MHQTFHGDKKSSSISYAAIIIIALFPIAALLLSNTPIILNTNTVIILLTAILIFTVNEITHFPANGSAWFGVRGLITLSVWFISGLATTSLVIVLSVVITAIINSRQNTKSYNHILTTATQSLALAGTPLMVATFISIVTGIPAPTSIDQILIATLIIVLAFVATHAVGQLLLAQKYELQPLWKKPDSIITELISVVEILPLVAIAQHINGIVFALIAFTFIVSLIIRKQVERKDITLSRRTTEITSITRLSDQLTTSTDLNETLDHITSVLKQMTRASVSFVGLYENEKPSLLEYTYINTQNGISRHEVQILESGTLEDEIIKTTHLIHIPSFENQQQRINLKSVDQSPKNSFLGIPLKYGNRIIGLLGLLADRGGSGFSDDELRVIKTIANQAGIAVENTKFQTNQNRVLANLKLINESTQVLTFKLSSIDATETICKTALAITSADRAAVFTLDSQTNQMKLRNGINLTPRHFKRAQAFDFPSGTQAKIVEDIHSQSSDPALIEIAEDGEFSAIAETLLVSGSQVIGMLAVYHKQPYNYPAIEINLLNILANQITVAIENTDLLQSIDIYASEMTQLVNLSRTSLTSLQLEEVAYHTVETLRIMLSVDTVTIGILQPVYEDNEIFIVLGTSPENIQTPDRKLLNLYPELSTLKTLQQNSNDHEGPVRYVIDVNKPGLSHRMRQMMNANGEHIIAAVPMTANNNMFGMVLLGNKESRQFTDREWQFIETATNLIAAQTQNAQLYNTTRQALIRRLEQLSFIEDLVQQITGSLSIDNIINSILETTTRVTQADTVYLVQRTVNDIYRIIRQQNVGPNAGREDRIETSTHDVVHEVLDTGNSVLSPAYGLPTDTHKTPRPGRYPSVLAVPLMEEGQVIGVLAVESAQRNFFTEEQVTFLQSLAGHTVISLANARYVAERQYQLEVLNQLRQLSLKVAGKTDKHGVAQEIIQTAQSILNAQQGALYQYYEKLNRFILTASPWQSHESDDQQPTLTPPPINLEMGLRAKETGKPQFSQRVIQTNDTPPKEIISTQLIIPLIRGAHVQEFLVLGFTGAYQFEKRELDAIELLASQAAGHLENTVLYEQIQSASNRTRTILESTHDGMVLLDRQDKIIDFNRAAEYMLGLKLRDYLDEKFDTIPSNYTILEPQDKPLDMMEKDAGATSEMSGTSVPIERIEMERRGSDGTTIYIEQTTLPVFDSQNRVTGRLLVFRNITEEKELAIYRDEIIFMLVHDLRSPLGSVIAGLDFAEDLLKDPENISYLPEVLRLAYRSSNRLMSLINTLLDVERDQMTMFTEEESVKALAESAQDELTQLAIEADKEVIIDIPDDLPLVIVDGEKIQRVLINLIDNALDYAETRIHIEAILSEDTNWIEVHISDDGPGISPEKRKSVFGKFSQGDGQENRRSKHTGIGLTFCRRAVEAHGGKIWVTDGCNLPGACFIFTLPVKHT